MFGCLRRVVGGAVTLVLVVAIAWAGYRWGGTVFPTLERWLGFGGEPEAEAEAPSQEIADGTLARIESLDEPGGPGRIAISGTEATSLLLYGVPGALPAGINRPRVAFEDDRMKADARLAPADFPELPALGGILGFLPDTLEIEVEGSVLALGEEGSAFLVRRIEAAGVPLPSRLYGDILHALGGKGAEGLPPEAVLLPLPETIRSVFLVGDSLVLVSRR